MMGRHLRAHLLVFLGAVVVLSALGVPAATIIPLAAVLMCGVMMVMMMRMAVGDKHDDSADDTARRSSESAR